MMLSDSSGDGCGGERDVMTWPDVDCESLQYERGVRPSIGRKPPGKTRFPAVFLSTNPSLQRHYERRMAKIETDRRHRQQSLERAQKVFFLRQAFDHDSNLRFGQQITKNRMDNNTGRVRHRKQRLRDVIGHNGPTAESVSLPRLKMADCETYHTSRSLDVATGAPRDDGYGHIQSYIATKSTPDVAIQQEDAVKFPSITTAKSSPAVIEFASAQIYEHDPAAASTSDLQQKRQAKKAKPGKEFRSQLSTIVEPVGHACFTTCSPEKSPPAHSGHENPDIRPANAVQEKGETETRESTKQAIHLLAPFVEETEESGVDFQLVPTQETCLPPIAFNAFITTPNKTSHVPLLNLSRGLSLFDRPANTQDESHTSHDNEIIARITRTLPTSLMRKMTLNEALMTHKKRLLDNSRKFASRDLFADPRWKSLERVLKDDGSRR